jgi:hypothetical protein
VKPDRQHLFDYKRKIRRLQVISVGIPSHQHSGPIRIFKDELLDDALEFLWVFYHFRLYSEAMSANSHIHLFRARDRVLVPVGVAPKRTAHVVVAPHILITTIRNMCGEQTYQEDNARSLKE